MSQSKDLNKLEFIIIKILRYIERKFRIKQANSKFEKLKKRGFLKNNEDTTNNGELLKLKDLKLSSKAYEDIKEVKENKEFIIGEIDQDGFVLSRVGEIPGFPLISEKDYMTRERFNIYLVAFNGVVGIKKMYHGNKYSFVNEYEILRELEKYNLNTPKILNVNFDDLTITISYIKGPVLREALAEKGAEIRDSQVGKASDYSYLYRQKLTKDRINQGKLYLYEVIDYDFYNELKLLVDKIHAKGILINDIKYGNIIIDSDSQHPYLIDFESSWKFTNTSSWKYSMFVKYENHILKKHFD